MFTRPDGLRASGDRDAPEAHPTTTVPDSDPPVSLSAPATLPIDSDIEVTDPHATARPRPVHLRWRFVGLVMVGGAVGTGVREALSLLIRNGGPFPVGVFVINVTGAFALGVVLETLMHLGPDEGHRRALRLLIGTGFMGGYTTYSTLAVGVSQAFMSGHVWVGGLYGVVSVVVGAAAAFAGIAVGAEIQRWRARPGEGSR